MSKLKAYFSAERGRATAMARGCDASVAFLRAIAAGERPCPHKLAVKIETFTQGEVSRRDLFPDDWHENWPELVGSDEKQPPALDQKAQAAIKNEVVEAAHA